eukprot:TRINITY_DN479_c1_g1_i1.p1 TRINITY_DN479_c1_g1~~TRINITY_DN479_c1_g1_i1.p1  ORF type:complete len:346 (-),score=100.01 TRINITY_DN479_c1_g1_i1:754-1707(-)
MAPVAATAKPLLRRLTRLDCQRAVLARVLRDRVAAAYPPSGAYTKLFLKAYLAAIDAEFLEVEEGLLELYMAALSRSEGDDGATSVVCYRSFPLPSCEDSLTIKTVQRLNPVGLVAWPAGFFLAEFLLNNPSLVENRTVLELGAGVGFTGLALACAARPARVVLTDYLPSVLDNLLQNVEINRQRICVGTEVEVSALDWSTPQLPPSCTPADVVIAADCVYDPELSAALVGTLAVALRPEGGRRPFALIASTLREPQTQARFFEELAARHLVAVRRDTHTFGNGSAATACEGVFHEYTTRLPGESTLFFTRVEYQQA